MSHPVADYLNDLHLISGIGVPETSGYLALRNLLNAVGDTLKPKITAVIHPANNGAGTRGAGFVDIHLNATTLWKDVPEPVWNYTLGGYQVLKKWLSYREESLLHRLLTSDEAQQFTHNVSRIASILALHEELDKHYRRCVKPLSAI